MNAAFLKLEPLGQHVTPSKNDSGPTEHVASFIGTIESIPNPAASMDACVIAPVDACEFQPNLYTPQTADYKTDKALVLQKQLYKTQKQLEAMTKERNEGVKWNNHLVRELDQTRSALHHERVVHDTNVQNALQHQNVVNERAVQSILACVLPSSGLSMFPKSLIIGSDGNVKNYLLEDTVGKGAFGSIVRATHIRTTKKAAVKIVPITSQGAKEEVKVLMYCDHPNVVRMHEYIVDRGQGSLGMVLELGHMDVNKYFECGNVLTLSTLREVTLATLKAIEYLHSQGICHMDIKSDNLLVMNLDAPLRQEHIKLCDFGLVSVAPPGETVVIETTLKGTPRFFAPEMANFMPYNAHAADIWSMGCMVLDLTDELPHEWRHTYTLFDDVEDVSREGFKTGLRRMIRLMNEEHYFDHKSNLAPAFDLVRRLLRFKPEFRLTATEALQHEWLRGQEPKSAAVARCSSLCLC